MKRTRIFSLIIALFAGLTILFGVGSGHSLLSQQSMSHGSQTGETSAQCLTTCPPLLNQQQKASSEDKDEADPDPLPYWAAESDQLATLSYLVLFSALAFMFLQRRPPDLVVLYANRRN